MSNENNIILEQNKTQVITLIEALQLYKDIAVKPMYKDAIERHILQIVDQLQVQGMHIYRKDYKPEYTIGDIVEYDGKNAVIVGSSNGDDFIKIAVSCNDITRVIDVPCVLIRRYDYENDNCEKNDI